MQVEKEIFKSFHGYEPNLDNPKTFNEKIVFKKLFDRNPLLTLTADKYRARDYIRKVIGWQAENHLIPLLWVGKEAECIPFHELVNDYVIKPNNGAGRWIMKEDRGFSIGKKDPLPQLLPLDIVKIVKSWFETIHGTEWHEWCYQEIDPLIIIEKLLHDKGDLPLDYKFMVFNGRFEIAYVLDRNDIHMTFYDRDWNLLPVTRKYHPRGEPIPKPECLDLMIEYAEKLSGPFDFVRVDFYLAGNKIYFGEITHYPGSGHGVFEPVEFDKELGALWK